MNAEDRQPLGDTCVDAVAKWMDETDLTGLPEGPLPAELPPPGAPVSVVRPIRLPYETDAMIKALADARRCSMSDLIRHWITCGIAEAVQTPDPVTELRQGLDRAQRALDIITRIHETHDREAA